MKSLSSKVTKSVGRRVPNSHYRAQKMLERGEWAAILQAPNANIAIGNPQLANLKVAAMALIRARSRIFSIQSPPSFSLGYG